MFGIALTGKVALSVNGGSITATGTENGYSAILSQATDAALNITNTKIQSSKIGIYLQNGGNAYSYSTQGTGNNATLTNVTITSETQCLWAAGKGDKFQVVGGNYISNNGIAVQLDAEVKAVSTFKDCTLSGNPIILAPGGNYTFTNVH